MNIFKLVSATLIAVMLFMAVGPDAMAEDDSITITIDRRTMPQSVFHAGRFFRGGPKTLTVYDYAIRDYLGKLTEGFTIQKSAGQLMIPIDTVKEININNWYSRRTDDIEYVENVARAEIILVDGSRIEALMNADFGTIEGKTDLGDFFLNDPHTVRRLVFNREEAAPVEPVEAAVEEEVIEVAEKVEEPMGPADSDGDGVLDDKDKCPNTPEGVEVDEDGCPPDSDGDGVADYKDKCPDTPKGAPVNSVGCWTIKGVNFDYNKWDIKPEYYGQMDENVKVLENNPTFKIEIQGHTDSIASEEFNQLLSEKRAESAKEYFISKGIDAARISTVGFGELKPIKPNDTPEGRAENRRIEIQIISR